MNKILMSVILLTSMVFSHNAPAKNSKGDFKRFCKDMLSEDVERLRDTNVYYFGYLYGSFLLQKSNDHPSGARNGCPRPVHPSHW